MSISNVQDESAFPGGPVIADMAGELWFHAALVMEMTAQALLVLVHTAALVTRILSWSYRT